MNLDDDTTKDVVEALRSCVERLEDDARAWALILWGDEGKAQSCSQSRKGRAALARVDAQSEEQE